jgi:hypothetical protein
MSIEENIHSKISPTAKITAYWRSFSDIPFSKEIAEAVGAEQTARKMQGDRIVQMGSISPAMFEVRFKSINYAINKSGINNVLELACGLSPRDLDIISRGGIYVGTDLPEMHEESSKVILAIAKREGIPVHNLYLQPANVLNLQELKNAAGHFGHDKFAVCNEGLLPYLNKKEKAIMAENIRELLLANGGCWITTDLIFIALREAIGTLFSSESKKVIQSGLKNISDHTGQDIAANEFANNTEAIQFYEDLGFTIEEYPMYAGDYKLSTYSLINEKIRDRLLEILSTSKVWIMKPRP